MRILSITPLADSAITVVLDDVIGAAAAASVRAAKTTIQAVNHKGIEEVTASYVSITVYYDAMILGQSDLVDLVRDALAPVTVGKGTKGRLLEVPCCYDPMYGEDQMDVARTLGCTVDDVIAAHLNTTFDVYAVGFLPGLPFLGDMPDGFSIPRRSTPRIKVPAGAVAIANGQSVIYPWESPGGWHIIGHCPVPLFDPTRDNPAVFRAGDQVKFVSISAENLATAKIHEVTS